MKTLLASLLLMPGLVFAQGRALTIDDLYDPAKRIDFSGGAPSGLAWMSDAEYGWPKPGERGSVEWVKVDAATGNSAPPSTPCLACVPRTWRGCPKWD